MLSATPCIYYAKNVIFKLLVLKVAGTWSTLREAPVTFFGIDMDFFSIVISIIVRADLPKRSFRTANLKLGSGEKLNTVLSNAVIRSGAFNFLPPMSIAFYIHVCQQCFAVIKLLTYSSRFDSPITCRQRNRTLNVREMLSRPIAQQK